LHSCAIEHHMALLLLVVVLDAVLVGNDHCTGEYKAIVDNSLQTASGGGGGGERERAKRNRQHQTSSVQTQIRIQLQRSSYSYRDTKTDA